MFLRFSPFTPHSSRLLTDPSGRQAKGRWTWWSAVTLILATLTVGAGVTWWAARSENERMRSELIAGASLAEKAVDWRSSANLSGSEADLLSPDYLRLKAQLTLVRAANPRYRFVYLMRQRPDRRVYFLVDSEQPDSIDYSAPGQEYTEVQAPFLQAFSTGREAVVGPVSDRWGEWVTALVPVTDPKTNKRVAVLGLDIDARGWHRAVVNACIPPAVITLLIACLLMAYFLMRRQSELVLANFETFFNSVEDLLFVLDGAGRILHVNHTAVSRLGYTNEELLNRPVLAVHPAERREEVGGIIEEMLEGQTGFCNVPLMAKDGRMIPVETRVTRSTWNGEPALFGVSKDVSQIERVQDALRESQGSYHALFENTANPILVIDASGDILNMNGAAMAFLERAHDEPQTMNMRDFSPPGENSALLKDHMPMWQSAGAVEMDFHVGSQVKTLSLIFSPAVLRGEPVVLGVGTDVTDSKRVVESLRRAEEERESAKSAWTLTRLAQGMAEDARNPLFSVNVNAAALETRAKETPAFSEHARHLKEHVRQLDSLMRDILALGRGPSAEATNPCLLRDVLQAAKLEVEELVPSSIGRILIETGEGNFTVRTVPNRLQKVFCQLILNALQNSPPEARVWVRIGLAGRDATVEVADEGFGIPESVRDSIFEPLVTTHQGSRGLGLALALQYMAAFGGTIHARNNDPPPGAVFTARLPLEG